MRVVFESSNLPLILDLQRDAPVGVTPRLYMAGERSAGDVVQMASAIITIVGGSAQAVAWLVAKLKKHPSAKVRINGVDRDLEKSTLEKVIQDLLKEQEGDSD